ncbi:MAG TPA: DNRLRE domain-containing protein [Planctomycetota bacterium]|nr:DNRLRE domain-containing protein [Planctomycetota bacterium]
MNPDRLSDLASRLFEEGALSPEEERELGLALRESPESRRLLLSYFRLEGAILEQARAGLVSTPAAARTSAAYRNVPPRKTPSFGAWISGLAAAAVLLGLLLFIAEGGPASAPAPSVARSPGERPEIRSSNVNPLTPPPESTASARESAPAPEAPGRPPKDQPLPRPSEQEPVLPQASTPNVPGARTEEEGPRPSDAVLTDVFLERVEGEVTLVGSGARSPGKAGDPVRAGQGLETGSGKSLAVLSFPDGTRIEARPETVLLDIRQKGGPAARSGKSVYLQRGSLWAEVRPQSADHPFVVLAPRGEARVVGTVFTLRMDPDPKGALRLDVQEGKVHFTRSADGRGVDVGAGNSVTSGQGADLVVVRSQEAVQSFQDGRFPTADYAGTRDTQLAEKNPVSAYGGAKLLLAEAPDPKEKKKASWPLLRWDLTSIPAGSRIHSVSVTLHVTEPSRGQVFYFFEPARAWSESEASWKFASAGNLWRYPGSLGAVERWGTPLGTLSPFQKGEYTTELGEAGTLLVQSWINAPATNLGLQIAGSTPGTGFHFYSREAQVPETRPRLTVVYTPKK